MSGPVTLRPTRPEDGEFLADLYASTREEELRPVPWSDAQKAAFLRAQFAAQDAHYRAAYPAGDFQVVERGGRPIGRLYLHRGADEIRVVDVALLPEHRRGGVGTDLLRSVLEEGDRTGRAVTVHVERTNPALRLYERLGFALQRDLGLYLLLRRPPGECASA